MERRAYLRVLGVTATGAIAGCGALQGNNGGTADGFTPTAADYLAVAVGKLNTVALAVDTFQEDDPRESTFDEAKPRDRLETASDSLDEAEGLASEDQQPDIDAVRNYLTIVESTVDGVVGLLSASGQLEEAQERIDGTDLDVEAVQEPITQATEASSGAVDARDRAMSASSEANGDRLAELDAEFEALRDGLDTLSGYITGVDGLASGYNTYLPGVTALQDADNKVSDDAFEAALSAFDRAVGEFDAASTLFADAQVDTPETLTADLNRGEQRSESLRVFAAGHMALLDGRLELDTAATAIENEEFEAARDALNVGNEAAATASEQFEAGRNVPIDEFAELFETADQRAIAMDALTKGYITVLDSHNHIRTAGEQFERGKYDQVRESLSASQDKATAADETFQAGQEQAEEFASTEFETARARANRIGLLAEGYNTLLDARESSTEAEAALFDDRYGAAREGFQQGAQQSSDAAATFQSDSSDGLFAASFDKGVRRAQAVESLTEGYTHVTEGLEDIAEGQQNLEARELDMAIDSFDAAKTSFSTASEVFETGRTDAGETFVADFEQALCQVDHLQAAAELYQTAVEAATDGNRNEAETAQEDAETELEQANEC